MHPRKEVTGSYQKITNSYIDIDPIDIGDNSSFNTQGFSGSGTSADPFILENRRITNKTELSLIHIRNTNAYFIIRNNYLDGINKSPYGIYLYNVVNGVVEKNIIINTNRAIHFRSNSKDNLIINNTIHDNQYGITASSSYNNTYTCNKIFKNTKDGISFVEYPELQQGSRTLSGNTITNNLIEDNEGYHGIYIECGTHNLVINNVVKDNNETGIDIVDGEQNTIYNNTVIGNKGAGIAISNGFTDKFHLYASSNITSNTIKQNHEGLVIFSWGDFRSKAGPNNVSKNIIVQNEFDSLYIDSSNYTITENIICANEDFGIEIESEGSDVIVKWNDFIGNLIGHDTQAIDGCGMNTDFNENYWDDWTYPDANEDGIVDNPYPIFGGFDMSPLTTPQHELPIDLHLLSRPRLLYPTGGEDLQGTITVKWTPVTDFSGHSVTYSLYYSPDEVDMAWEKLGTDLTNPTYEWDTTTVENDYNGLLKVVAKCSEGVTSEYVLYDPIDIENPTAAPGWSFTMIVLTFCMGVIVTRAKKKRKKTLC
ncbi:MAG: nitrous oxide reductase family maturation protein NosD [Promethearchaeota archaeon]